MLGKGSQRNFGGGVTPGRNRTGDGRLVRIDSPWTAAAKAPASPQTAALFAAVRNSFHNSETPAFTRLLEEKRLAQAPVSEVWRSHWRPMVWVILVRMVELTPYYIFTSYIYAYGVTRLHLPQSLLLTAVMCAAALSWFTIPFAGWLSDVWGRKKVMLLGGVWIIVYGFAYFWLLDTRNAALVIAAIVLSLVPHDLMWGAFGAFVSENFPARLRYSGAGISSQLGSVIPGGLAPLVAVALVDHYHSGYAIAVYLAVCGLVGVFAITRLKEYAGKAEMAGGDTA